MIRDGWVLLLIDSGFGCVQNTLSEYQPKVGVYVDVEINECFVNCNDSINAQYRNALKQMNIQHLPEGCLFVTVSKSLFLFFLLLLFFVFSKFNFVFFGA